MHTVDIEIFCIAQTRMNEEETRRWLDRCGASETPVPIVADTETIYGPQSNDGMTVYPGKKKEVSDAGAVCGLCAKRCYMSFEPGLNPNVTRVRKVWHEYLTNILKSGHGSVIEHATWTFAIEGVSRVFTGELNRHRAGVAISEGSMRYIRFDDIGFWMPTSLAEGSKMLMPTRKCKVCGGTGDMPGVTCEDCDGTGRLESIPLKVFERKKETTRYIFEQGFNEMESNYKSLCTLWGIEELKDFNIKKKLTSMFRRLIGMGVATGGTWTFNARALRHILALRTSPHAEEEIAMVMGMIGKYICSSEPALFGDFSIDPSTGTWIPENAKI